MPNRAALLSTTKINTRIAEAECLFSFVHFFLDKQKEMDSLQRSEINIKLKVTYDLQRYFIIIGITLIILGLLWPWLQKIGWFRLPGDIVIEKENFKFYFPITSSILISLVISLILILFKK